MSTACVPFAATPANPSAEAASLRLTIELLSSEIGRCEREATLADRLGDTANARGFRDRAAQVAQELEECLTHKAATAFVGTLAEQPFAKSQIEWGTEARQMVRRA